VTKIERIRASTAAASAPNISDRAVPDLLPDLAPVTAGQASKRRSRACRRISLQRVVPASDFPDSL